jgi:ubiquinone/menaquinone biosynthesis C-methylase UbiE
MWLYDRLALGFCCRFIWQCPSGYTLDLYNQKISGNHLDIGAGTGYFLDQCRFPIKNPRLVIIDINSYSLARAEKRLKRYHPQVYCRNVLEPLPLNIPGFDSIAVTHLLHCLPGDLDAKGAVFRNILPLLNPGGIVFGTTFLYQEIQRSIPATFTFQGSNLCGFMTNKQDSPEGLSRILKKYFSESHMEIRGCAALFWARK